MKKAFTLTEILIVTIIIGILVWVLFRTYITISQISFRVEQQKFLNQEVLFVSETLQNFANKNKIDYHKYSQQGIDLHPTKWITDVLYLSWEDGKFSVYSTGACIALETAPTPSDLQKPCYLVVEKDWKFTRITESTVYISKVIFKIIPYADSQAYINNTALCESNYLACLHDHGFWFFSNFYSKWYSPANRSSNVTLFIQQFFNI
jgi:prepilin-type N-terminal cleavage/methylation domain-containing protein